MTTEEIAHPPATSRPSPRRLIRSSAPPSQYARPREGAPMTADLIYLSTRRRPAKAVPIIATPEPEAESAPSRPSWFLTKDVMNGLGALVLTRSKTAKPMTPEVRRERIAAL